MFFLQQRFLFAVLLRQDLDRNVASKLDDDLGIFDSREYVYKNLRAQERRYLCNPQVAFSYMYSILNIFPYRVSA
jgi:hypothetical protein